MRRGAATVRERVLAVLSLGMVLGLGAVGTMAIWTDTSTTTSTFATGTVSLKLGPDSLPAFAFTSLDVSGLAPGSTKAALITVRNRGTLPIIYSVGVTATNADGKNLANNLKTTVLVNSTVVGSGLSSTCSTAGSAPVSDRSTLAGGPDTVGGQLNPLGDQFADQAVCVQVGLPAGAPSSVQGGTTTATFTFTGTTF